MNESTIKRERLASRLQELINEALSSMNDARLRELVVVDVEVSRGKYDADVFLEGSNYNKEEEQKILFLLKKASGYIAKYCLSSEDWFRVPKFHFKFDESLKSKKRIDELFEMIKK